MVKVTSVGLKQDGHREKQGFRLVLLSRLAFKLHSSERVIANVSYLFYRPLELQAVRISRQSAHEGGKVVSPTHRPPLPLRGYPWYSFCSEAESIPGLYC